jgi:hypothetical protein
MHIMRVNSGDMCGFDLGICDGVAIGDEVISIDSDHALRVVGIPVDLRGANAQADDEGWEGFNGSTLCVIKRCASSRECCKAGTRREIKRSHQRVRVEHRLVCWSGVCCLRAKVG